MQYTCDIAIFGQLLIPSKKYKLQWSINNSIHIVCNRSKTNIKTKFVERKKMKSLIKLVPLVVLLFGKLFCEIAPDAVYPTVETVSSRSRTAIGKRSIEPVLEIKKVTARHTEATNGDGESMELAETHLFRPLLGNRIRKSSHTSEPSTHLSHRNN